VVDDIDSRALKQSKRYSRKSRNRDAQSTHM
jgi:hypothetical protein